MVEGWARSRESRRSRTDGAVGDWQPAALAESGEAAPKLAKMSSTTFDSQLLVSEAVAQDNPRLYFEIQNLNRFGLGPLDALCEAARRIRETVAAGDESAFVELMERGRDYLAMRG